MLGLILYYIVSASAMLFYGIGINRTISLNEDYSSLSLAFFKGLLTSSSTCAVSYLVITWLLTSCGLEELFPIVVILVYIIFLLLVEIFVGIGIRKSGAEFAIPLLSVILGLNESLTIAHAVVITCCCICSFYTMLILLISLSVIVLAFCAWNASWINLALGGLNW